MTKRVLITGASKGLGKVLAELFGEAGYELLIIARTEEPLKELTTTYAGEYLVGDICDKETQEKLVKKATEKPLDVVIQNAGRIIYADPEDLSEESYNNLMELNLKTPMFLTKGILPSLRKQKKGHIIFINSTAGQEGRKDISLYSTTKFALRGYAEAIRNAVKKDNIRVTSVYPGGMKTHLFDETDLDKSEYMDPKEVGKLILNIAESKDICPDELLINRK